MLDGYDRVRATAKDHPGSAGGYSAQYFVYDKMRRLEEQSNPTEITVNWQATGDDSEFIYSKQYYDWQGRPTTTINTDTTTKQISYTGCGCAGGQVVEFTDEVGRKQDQTFDEYSTSRVGPAEVGHGQETTFVYDGHGRLQYRHRPIEETGFGTTFVYNPDDTIYSIDDPRGVTAVYSYNGRKLVTGIDYDEVQNVSPPPQPLNLPSSDVTFVYDEVGNRKIMDDGPGQTQYSFDNLGRLISETRQFSIINRSYTIGYEYNISGQLKKITDPWNASVTYIRDKLGRVTGATGQGYANINQWTNQAITQFASNIKYRAWDAVKEMTNGNISSQANFAFGYDPRLRLTSFNGGGRVTTHQYYDDGRVEEVQDQHISNFNRHYSYDHVGRLTSASAGTNANPNLNPYAYTYQYDEWGNTTQRSGHYWSTTVPNSTANYGLNNRDTTATYDKAGNMTHPYLASGQTPVWKYDAAGRLSQSVRSGGAPFTTYREHYEYDGDGQRAGYNSYYESHFPSYATGSHSYQFFIRSSVLGGEVLAEITGWHSLSAFNDPVEYMSNSYVYLNGQRLAYQHMAHWTEAEASEEDLNGVFGKQVRWLYREPVIQTESTHYRMNLGPNNPYDWSYETFVDPAGTAVATSDPALQQPPIPPIDPPILNFRYNGENHLDWDGGCVVDGRPMACDRAMRLLSSGAAYLRGHGRYTHNIIQTGQGTYFLHLLPDTGEGYHVDNYRASFLQAQRDLTKEPFFIITQSYNDALEFLKNSDCRKLLASNTYKDPAQLLKTINRKGQIIRDPVLDKPITLTEDGVEFTGYYAAAVQGDNVIGEKATIGIGKAFLEPLSSDDPLEKVLTDRGARALYILHELAHATGKFTHKTKADETDPKPYEQFKNTKSLNDEILKLCLQALKKDRNLFLK